MNDPRVLIPLITGLIVVVVFLLVKLFERSGSSKSDNSALSLLQGQVNSSIQQTTQQIEALRTTMSESMQTLSGQVSHMLSDTNKTVGSRLEETTKVIGNVRQQLGQLEASSRNIAELGKDISKLEDILKPPTLRGSLGELFLADLLSQVLPPSHYHLQYQFKGGETVDAVVVLKAGMVPIDAKFPLENFRRIFSSETEEDRKSAKKNFVKNVKGHIDAIASKYIRMDENTFDFALMYIPAENIYYETIIKEDDTYGSTSLFSYAMKKRVIPVSPNSFYAYLQTIILGLKGMRVEESSREIIDNLSRLQKEFQFFSEAFRLVGQHLDKSVKKYAEAETRFSKMEAKVDKIDGLAKGLQSSEPETEEKEPDLTKEKSIL